MNIVECLFTIALVENLYRSLLQFNVLFQRKQLFYLHCYLLKRVGITVNTFRIHSRPVSVSNCQ